MDKEKDDQTRSRTDRLSSSNQGQVALVFLVLILIGLFFLGVTAHWNKMAASRTQVTIASNLGAATLASYLASYTQATMDNQLGGAKMKCDPVGFWSAIGSLFVGTTETVVDVGISAADVSSELSSMGATLAATSVGGANIAPGTALAWNVLLDEKTLIEDRITEAVVGRVLPLAVSDAVSVIDEHDFDMDGKRDDPISRFAFLYSKRVWNLKADEGKAEEKCKPFEELKDALKNLAQALGMEETECDVTSLTKDAGNPCCVPDEYRPVHNKKCWKDPLQAAFCRQLIPYFPDPAQFREWPYDDGYCEGKKEGTLLNFIGMDDGNPWYKMKNPNTWGSPQERQTWPDGSSRWGYRGYDSLGDRFSLLWELKDSVIDLGYISRWEDRQCHWTDRGELLLSACDQAYPDFYRAGSVLLENVHLPRCAELGEVWCYTQHPSWNSLLDKVHTVEAFFNMGETDVCPQDPGEVYGPSADKGPTTSELLYCGDYINSLSGCQLKKLKAVWRPGWDADGSEWPYWNDLGNVNQSHPCFSGGAMQDDVEPFLSSSFEAEGLTCRPVVDGGMFETPCGCEQLAYWKSGWTTDSFDEAAVRLRQMIREMQALEGMKCESASRADVWSHAVQWVTFLRKIRCDILSWRRIYELWLVENHVEESDTTTWCLPSARPPDMPEVEYKAILVGAAKGKPDPCDPGGMLWGNLESVTACMDWNRDNQYRFDECWDNCKKVIPDKRICAVNEDGSPGLGCGMCSVQSCPERDAEGNIVWRWASTGEDGSGYWYYINVSGWHLPGCGDPLELTPKQIKEYDPENPPPNPPGRQLGWWAPPDWNWGPESGKCEKLPRSFSAHSWGYDDTSMEEYFWEDSCCNSTMAWTPFAQRVVDGGGEPVQDVNETVLKESKDYKEMTSNRFSKRSAYLKEVKRKIEDEMEKLRIMAKTIDDAVTAFEPKVAALCEQLKESGDPKTVYYVWSNPKVTEDSRPAWHAVKVEVKMPGRCGDDGACLAERLPWTTLTTGWNRKCAELKNSRGMGSVTVWRYDDERTPLSVIKGPPSSADSSPLAACESAVAGGLVGTGTFDQTKAAYVSCEGCTPFGGMLKGACKTAVEKAMASATSVKTEMKYWVTQDPRNANKSRVNFKIRQQ